VSRNPDLTGPPSEVARLVAFECGRAEQWFAEGLQLLPVLGGRGRACVAAMSGIYHRLLLRIERNPLAVTEGRVSLPAYEKITVALQSLAAARA
jgi:15-cis-phytoene synthase